MNPGAETGNRMPVKNISQLTCFSPKKSPDSEYSNYER